MYKYESPLDKGYKRFYLTTKEHNNFFPNRRKTWVNKFEYYISGSNIELHKFLSFRAICFNLIIFPLVVIIEGLGNFKEICRDYRKMLDEKKYGYFSSDYVSSKAGIYIKIKDALKD